MCLLGGGDDQDPIVPDSPPETLDQEAPEKKTSNKETANSLAIGTKRYATPASSATASYPSVSN